MSLEQTSKFIALVLRHQPEAAGITLDGHGWAQVDELIAGVSRRMPLTREMLEEIVRTDNKQRYSLFLQSRSSENPGKPGAFHSGECGTEAGRAPGYAVSRNRGKVCGIHSPGRPASEIPAVCPSLPGRGNGRTGGKAPRKACPVPGGRGCHGPGRVCVLSLGKPGVADPGSAGQIPDHSGMTAPGFRPSGRYWKQRKPAAGRMPAAGFLCIMRLQESWITCSSFTAEWILAGFRR